MSFLRKNYTIDDLKTLSIYEDRFKWRDNVHIAIIDDEGLSDNKLEGLRNRNFNIQPLSDVENVRLLNDYPIIISDIHGVAHKIDPEKEGFALITELAKLYPFKGLAVYSGKLHKLPSLPEGVLVIPKDDDLETWAEKIDTLIDRISNPQSVWRNFAKKLIDKGVTSDELRIIENEYVRTILGKKNFNDFLANKKGISDDAKSVINSLIANGIFLAMTKLLALWAGKI